MTGYYHYLDEYKDIYSENKKKINWSLKFHEIVNTLNRNASVIAKEIGFSDENVLEVLQGKSTPSFAMLVDIVRYLHVNPEWLYYENNDVSVLKDDLRKRDSSKHIAERVETLMQGSSKRSFALETGIHYQVLMKLIGNADADVNESVIRKIADRCDVGFEWLLCGDENAKEDPCNDSMTNALNKREDVREHVFQQMPNVEIQNTEQVYSLLERAHIYDKNMIDHESDKSSVGNRIKAIRSIYQCSLRDFAMMTGVSKSSVSNWENGRNKPDDFALRRISESLNIGKDWILYGNPSALCWPCDKRMVEFLKEEPVIRKQCRRVLIK